MGSHNASHKSHANEIASIIEELREEGFIKGAGKLKDPLIDTMNVDEFEHNSHRNGKIYPSSPQLRSRGYDLTAERNYSLKGKLLRNVTDPVMGKMRLT